MLSARTGVWVFPALTVLIAAVALLVPRMDLPPSYHNFADQRVWLGIPHFGDVTSNLAFLVAGFCGLIFLSKKSSLTQFVDPRERWPYAILFFGLVMTAVGSAYYHWAPSDARLVWDRVPMTVVFMPLVAALIEERVNLKLGLCLLPFLTALGIVSVIHWHETVRRGAGDLRFYGAVQVYAGLALLVALLLPEPYTRGTDLLVVAAFYTLAKICEAADQQIFSLGHVVSGHTLKHLAAGLAVFWILRMIQKRQPIQNQLAR